jgi:hypothetical protein
MDDGREDLAIVLASWIVIFLMMTAAHKFGGFDAIARWTF